MIAPGRAATRGALQALRLHSGTWPRLLWQSALPSLHRHPLTAGCQPSAASPATRPAFQPLTDCRIVHRALNSYFDAYSAALGRYIPSRKLQVWLVWLVCRLAWWASSA